MARGRELAHLDHILWAARRGASSVVALRGEPGVGKSALIEAAVARATDFAVVQLRGAALLERQAPPREWPAPIIELLRQHDPTGRRQNGGRSPAEGEPEHAQQAGEALRRLLGSGPAPLLVTVDDCQLFPSWVPAALAVAVLDHLPRSPVAVVLAWQDTPNMGRFELDGVQVPEHRLEGLNFDQARSLLRQRHLPVPAAKVLAALVEATTGNPVALMDVCSHLGPDQLDGWRPLPEPLPVGESVVRGFGQSLHQLPEQSRHALAAAAAGRVPVNVLKLVLHEISLPTEALRPAERAGIVAVRGNRLDFAHPLVRAAAFRLAPIELRQAIHAAIARAYSASGYVERSAFHASQNASSPDDAVCGLYAQAARVALDRGDAEAAAHHEESASDFAESDDVAAHHLVQAASLWASAGQLERSGVCLDRADERHPSDPVRAELEYLRARSRLMREVGDHVANRMFAAASLREADAPQRAMLMLVDGVASRLLAGGSQGTVDAAERAVSLAAAVSSHAEALARATLGAAVVLEGDPTGQARPAIVAATSLLIGQTQRFAATPHLAFVIGAALVQEGQRDQAMRWSQWIDRCADTVGDRALSAVPPLLQAMATLAEGRLAESVGLAEAAADRAIRCEDRTLAARALGTLIEAHGARGAHEPAFASALKLFALPAGTGRWPRLQAFVVLAGLELQRGRVVSATAWLGAAEEEEEDAASDESPDVPGAEIGADSVRALWAPAVAEVLLLARHGDRARDLVDLVERAHETGAVPRAWVEWIGALTEDDIDQSGEHFQRALGSLRGMPLVEGRLELSWGARLVEASRPDQARRRLEVAAARFRGVGAAGWASVAERELERLPVAADLSQEPTRSGVAGLVPTEEPAFPPAAAAEPDLGGESAAPGSGGRGWPQDAPPPWQVFLLGSFSVRRHGKEVSLPLSLAAQALKIVALREKVLVDELVELLWSDAEPGVGTRRLRNVLWRVRAACGELLQREGNFIRLAPEAVSDVVEFKFLADQALDRHAPSREAGAKARRALELYRGELLPGDRYADWTVVAREGLSRLQVQLLDLLLAEAIREDRRHDALGVLDRLIEADPYDEHYYLQAAELHAQAGNRRRALSILARAERMLADLGVPPSSALVRVRNSLGAG